jgi:hypothetical protein
LAIIFLGFGLGFADISMNSQAVLCEKMNRSPTLGLFHGIFACGALVSALLCGVLLSFGASVLEEIGIICSIMLLPTILFRYWLFSSAEEQLILQSEALFIRNSTRGLHILLCCPCKYVRLLITVIFSSARGQWWLIGIARIPFTRSYGTLYYRLGTSGTAVTTAAVCSYRIETSR